MIISRTGHRPDNLREEICSLYNQGFSIRQIENYVPLKRTRIASILKECGVNLKSVGNSYRLRKYELNQNYFNCINTEEKAYWLGFIMADGHVSDNGIHIVLAIKDEKHLVKFLNAVKSNAKITKDINNTKVSISLWSKTMVDSLRKLGLLRNKSFSAIFPNILFSLQKDFIRGYFDGDGSINSHKRKNRNATEFRISICGTNSIVNSITDIINSQVHYRKNKLEVKENGFTISSWGGNRKIQPVLDWLYEDSCVYLERKYNKYIELKNLYL